LALSLAVVAVTVAGQDAIGREGSRALSIALMTSA
jgi:hypothetical protein